MEVARRPGNPEVLVKRRHTDIPVSVYFFRSLSFLIYFYEGPFTRFYYFNFFHKRYLKTSLLRGPETIRNIYIYKVVFEK